MYLLLLTYCVNSYVNIYYYHAVLMHSVDYAVARCLSICLSVTRRYYVETAKHIIKHSQSGSHSIQVFSSMPYGNIPMGSGVY